MEETKLNVAKNKNENKIEEVQTETIQETNQKKTSSSFKLWVRAIAFILIAILILGWIQGIVTKKWYYPTFENVYQTVNGIDAVQDNMIEALFVGTSHMEYGIAPIQIYQDTGIVTYNLSTSKQSCPNTYYLLKRVFKKQSPKVVVFDVSAAFLNNKDNAPWRFLLDSMKLDYDKMDMLFNGYRKTKNTDGFFAGLFPIIKYHNRWEELTKADFEPAPKGFYYSAGQYVRALTQPTDVTEEEMNVAADQVDDDEFHANVRDANIKWIKKMDQLCKENGSQLLLVKIPVIGVPGEYHSSWTEDRSKAIKEVADKLGISYYDFQYDTDLGIDYQKETVDEGHHLNMFGAVKATNAMEKYLLEHYDLDKTEYPLYASVIPLYEKIWKLGIMHTTDDCDEYFDMLLKNQDNVTIAIASQRGVMNGLSDETKAYFEKLGLKKVYSCKPNQHYGAIVSGKKIIWEETDKKEILEQEIQLDVNTLKVESEKNDTQILLNGQDEITDGSGVYMVIIDRETSVAIESLVISENAEGKTVLSRDLFGTDDRFQLYENVLTSN